MDNLPTAPEQALLPRETLEADLKDTLFYHSALAGKLGQEAVDFHLDAGLDTAAELRMRMAGTHARLFFAVLDAHDLVGQSYGFPTERPR